MCFPPPVPVTSRRPGGGEAKASPFQKQHRVLDEEGICGVGERLTSGDILVNKHTPINTTRMDVNYDDLSAEHYKPVRCFRAAATCAHLNPRGSLRGCRGHPCEPVAIYIRVAL